MSEGFFYLSMVDERRPKGDQFIGATIVYAEDNIGALEAARLMGLIPTGAQVAIVELFTQDDSNERIDNMCMLPIGIPALMCGRVASKAEIEKSGGTKPLGNDVDAFICKDCANP